MRTPYEADDDGAAILTEHTWTLTVEFGWYLSDWTAEEEAADFRKRVLADWAIGEEDLEPGEFETEGGTVRITQDVVDYLAVPLKFATAYYCVKRMELKRNDPKGDGA